MSQSVTYHLILMFIHTYYTLFLSYLVRFLKID